MKSHAVYALKLRTEANPPASQSAQDPLIQNANNQKGQRFLQQLAKGAGSDYCIHDLEALLQQ